MTAPSSSFIPTSEKKFSLWSEHEPTPAPEKSPSKDPKYKETKAKDTKQQKQH